MRWSLGSFQGRSGVKYLGEWIAWIHEEKFRMAHFSLFLSLTGDATWRSMAMRREHKRNTGDIQWKCSVSNFERWKEYPFESTDTSHYCHSISFIFDFILDRSKTGLSSTETSQSKWSLIGLFGVRSTVQRKIDSITLIQRNDRSFARTCPWICSRFRSRISLKSRETDQRSFFTFFPVRWHSSTR